MCENILTFPGGGGGGWGGVKQETLPWGGGGGQYGYFLELHNRNYWTLIPLLSFVSFGADLAICAHQLSNFVSQVIN